MIRTEVIIVGGGPAGASCARKLHQAGMDCLIIDKQQFPRPKTCAGWITPKVLSDLQLVPSVYPHSFTRFKSFQISLKGFKFTIPTHQYAIRRIEFDDWLLKESAARVVQHNVKEIAKDADGYSIDGEYHCRYLVGAGGTYCPVRKSFFPEAAGARQMDQIVAMEEEFEYPFEDDRCHLWFMENGLPGYSWYVPKAGGYVNVGVGGKVLELKKKRDDIQKQWEFLTRQLARMGLVRGYEYHPHAHTYYLRADGDHLRKDNVLLVGDSAGLATRDMGEGIGAAVRSGIRAAEAILTGADYSVKSVPQYSLWSILFGW